jgi:hypothetical protein
MDQTYFYGSEAQRMRAAQDLYDQYCQYLYSDPARAKTQMIAGIQIALAQAFAQGANNAPPASPACREE